MDTINYLEWFGYLASTVVAVSLLMNSILRLRWINLVGACLFSVYGLLIGALPVFFLNGFIVAINAYYLWQLYKQTESFKISEVAPSATYLHDFLEFYSEDIREKFPRFDFKVKADAQVFFLLRNVRIAGVFIAHPVEGNGLMIDLDYTTPEYRDFKLAHYFFREQNPIFRKMGVERLISLKQSLEHNKYLIRQNFKATDFDGASCYVLTI